jgi:hypothetical protein
VSPPALLGELQKALETIYGVSAPHRVEDFVVEAKALQALGASALSPEELYVLEDQGAVEIGLYLSPEVLRRLPSLGQQGVRFLEGILPAFSTAAEGVSHFVYLTLQALKDRAVSLLELEVQAEIDKFATSALHLWKEGERHRSAELRQRLFERVGYRGDLSGDEKDRYVTANRLARGYAEFLEDRFLKQGRLEELLRELRRVYRLTASEKMAYLAQRG